MEREGIGEAVFSSKRGWFLMLQYGGEGHCICSKEAGRVRGTRDIMGLMGTDVDNELVGDVVCWNERVFVG